VPTVVDLDRFGARVRRDLERAERRVRRVLLPEVADRIIAKAIRIADAEDLIDRHSYKDGWRIRQTAEGPEVVNDAPHAPTLEHGRRPNRPGPPIDPILGWVRRKLFGGSWAEEDEPEIERVAWAIRESIHRKGSPPRMVLRRAMDGAEAHLRQLVRERGLFDE
jgi:hypothetical protein